MATITNTRKTTNQPAPPLTSADARALVRGYDPRMPSSESLEVRGKPITAEKKSLIKTLGKRVLALGLATGITLGVLHDGEKKPTPKVTAVVQQNDSPYSMVDRYNDDTVNVSKLADEMLEQKNVRDGLIPDEKVRVPVQSPEPQAPQAKP